MSQNAYSEDQTQNANLKPAKSKFKSVLLTDSPALTPIKHAVNDEVNRKEINSTSADPNQTRDECGNEFFYEFKKLSKFVNFYKF